MNEFQMLLELNKLDKSLSLNMALEIVGQTIFIGETLEEENHVYDQTELLKETWDYAIKEL